jgi:hypothetical protein
MNGGYPDDYTQIARLSGDGRTIAFQSQAADVVEGDTQKTTDIFFRDIASVPVGSFTQGRAGGAPLELVNLSADGRFILFGADADGYSSEDRNGSPDGFVYDKALGRITVVTVGRDGSSLEAGGKPLALSGDGRAVAFKTTSPELAGDAGGMVTCFSVREPLR